MAPVILFLLACLGNPQHTATDTSPQNTQRGVLDVVVFYADSPRDTGRYPLQVRQELRGFVERARAYRPRPRPARRGSEMRMVDAARDGYEGKLAAAAPVMGASRLARQYVDALRPCYEWEGFHDCPEREAIFAEQYLRQRPDTPFRDVLRVLAAHRWLCAAEGYEHERKPADALRARRAYEEALTVATNSRSPLMAAAASELKASGRCYAENPFRKNDAESANVRAAATRAAM
jgi:hypothetical protein